MTRFRLAVLSSGIRLYVEIKSLTITHNAYNKQQSEYIPSATRISNTMNQLKYLKMNYGYGMIASKICYLSVPRTEGTGTWKSVIPILSFPQQSTKP